MVGTGRFELPTCRLGGDRSIHLSYVPESGAYLILNHFSVHRLLHSVIPATKLYQNCIKTPYVVRAVSKPLPSSFACRFSFCSASLFIWSFICEYFLNTCESP